MDENKVAGESEMNSTMDGARADTESNESPPSNIADSKSTEVDENRVTEGRSSGSREQSFDRTASDMTGYYMP